MISSPPNTGDSSPHGKMPVPLFGEGSWPAKAFTTRVAAWECGERIPPAPRTDGTPPTRGWSVPLCCGDQWTSRSGTPCWNGGCMDSSLQPHPNRCSSPLNEMPVPSFRKKI